ncbi:Protein MCM10-like protein [Aphelenchoides fujianensis]|nr:Protein MCM10-like protein [Aphelenchoides fujianensis]
MADGEPAASSSKSVHFPVFDSDFSPRKCVRKSEKSEEIPMFDSFFGIRVLNPRFPLETFNVYCRELQKIRLNSISAAGTLVEQVTMAVLVESSGIRQSSNGNDYLVWHLSDLVADSTVKTLLFGDAVKAHSAIPRGHVVALTNPELAADTSGGGGKSTATTLKIHKALHVLSLGPCPDFGTCKGRTKEGKPCTNFVNVAAAPLCSYHVQTEAAKLRANRGSFSAVSNERPKCQIFRSPQKRSQPTTPSNRTPKTPKDASKPSPASANRSVVASKARLGHKAMLKLEELEREKENLPASPAASPTVAAVQKGSSLKEYLGKRSRFDLIRKAAKRAGTPQLGRSVQHGNVADLASPPKKLRRMSPVREIPSPNFDLVFGDDVFPDEGYDG